MLENNELSDREREVLRLVATGASNKEIAQQLYISTNTVKVHLRNIFAKIGVASRTEATLYAIREGMIQVSTLPADANPSASLPLPESVISPPIGRSTRKGLHPLGWVAVAAMLLIFVGSLALLTTRTPIQVAASPPAVPIAPPRWQEKAPLPTARSGLAATIYENQIYAIGGETKDGVTSAVERYNVSANTWSSLTPKPVAVTDASAAVILGKIYVPGGRLPSGMPTDILEIYDPQHDRWDQGASLPLALSAYSMVAFEGKLYVFGGWDGTKYLDSSFLYDPGKNSWKSISRMSVPRAFAGAAVAGGKIYVIGGYDGTSAVRSTDEYLPERDDGSGNPWTKRADLPAGRYSTGTASIGGNIYLLGGQGDSKMPLLPLQYSPQQDEWQSFDSPIAGQWSRLAFVPNETNLYAFGGDLGGSPTAKNLTYQAIYNMVIPAFP